MHEFSRRIGVHNKEDEKADEERNYTARFGWRTRNTT